MPRWPPCCCCRCSTARCTCGPSGTRTGAWTRSRWRSSTTTGARPPTVSRSRRATASSEDCATATPSTGSEVDAADAAKGVENGAYYLSLTVPEDFSQRIASSSGDDPQTGALKVRTNDANNYIVGQISRTVFSEVRAAASSKASRGPSRQDLRLLLRRCTTRPAKAADGRRETRRRHRPAPRRAPGKLPNGLGDAGRRAAAGSSDGRGRELDTPAPGKLKQGRRRPGRATVPSNWPTRSMASPARWGPSSDEHGKEIGTAAQLVADVPARSSRTTSTSCRRGRPGRRPTPGRTPTTLAELYQARCEGARRTRPRPARS